MRQSLLHLLRLLPAPFPLSSLSLRLAMLSGVLGKQRGSLHLLPDANVPAAGSEAPKVEAPAAAASPGANVPGDGRSPPKKRQKVKLSPVENSFAESLFAQIQKRDILAQKEHFCNGAEWDLGALLAALQAQIGHGSHK